MLGRLIDIILSDYDRMVLATVGPMRFLGKLPSHVLREARRLQARAFPPRPWSQTAFLRDEQPSALSGCWLFGAMATPDSPAFSRNRECVLERAEKARQGVYEVNGLAVDVNSPPCNGRWDIDPQSGRSWPQDSVFAPLRNSLGDVRFPWELGRLHHLVWFGQAWRYTRDPVWVDAGVLQLEKMLCEAPFEHGIHWRDGLQLAVRVYSLAAFADLCHDAPKAVHAHLNNAIAAHAHALTRQISPHSEITNNHVIGESCALALAGLYFGRDDYLGSGLRRLRIEVKRQLYADGVPYEGTIPYIRFDLDFISLLALAFSACRKEIPGWLIQSVGNMARALASLVDDHGSVPPIGDGDDARVLRLDDEPYLTVNESLVVAGKLLGQSLAPAAPSGSFALWAVGPVVLPAKPVVRTAFLPVSGLVHLNRGALDVWLDCGPTGCGLAGPGGHGHNDTTAIVAHLDGVALLHDPGWYTYHGDRVLRDQLRSTGAHNTLRVDSQEQARLGGVFEILDDCKPTPVAVREFGTATVITCGHTGFDRLQKGVTYRRSVVLEGSGPWRLRVTDRIRSRVPVKAESHLGSDLKWSASADEEWLLAGKHHLRFRSPCKDVRVLSVPCSRKTGVLERGMALDWVILPRKISAPSGINYIYISRWELVISPAN